MTLRVVALALIVASASVGGPSGAPAPSLLVFEAADGIHFVNSDGTGLRRLPDTVRGDQNPRWSPDGRQLTFWNGTGNSDADGGIYVCNADGTGRRLLAEGQHPAWSPDGRLIAFHSVRDGDLHLYVMSEDGSNVHRVDTGHYAGWYVEWNPAGGLSFDAGWGEGIAPGAVYPNRGRMVVGLDGSGLRRLPTALGDVYGSAWSPDGKAYAYSLAVGGKGEIEVTQVEGGRTLRLTHNNSEDDTPLWSPDGKEISFTTERNGLPEVYVMNADGTHQRRVTRFPTTYACCGDWKPS